jgi:hypothetical protein
MKAELYSQRNQADFGNHEFAHFAEFLACMSSDDNSTQELYEGSDQELANDENSARNLRKRSWDEVKEEDKKTCQSAGMERLSSQSWHAEREQQERLVSSSLKT